MGQGYVLKCSRCKYELEAFLGFGFMFLDETKKTIEEMKSGAYGEKASKFFQKHPDGTVDCSNVLLRCDNCGDLKTDRDLTLYRLKEGVSAADAEFPFPDPEFYEPAEEFDHKCEKCGHTMQILDTSEDFFKMIGKGKIRCPVCRGKLQIDNIIMWD